MVTFSDNFMAAKKALLIVDDHTLFREGLKTIISRNPAYEVVGETGRGETALQMAKSLRPDLILVDISLPDQSGIDLALQLRKSLPKAFRKYPSPPSCSVISDILQNQYSDMREKASANFLIK